MGPAAIIGVGLAAGALQGYSARKGQKQQNAYLNKAANQYNAPQMLDWMKMMNPQFMAGYSGKATSGPGQYIAQMANQPGYIDPALMNEAYRMSSQRAQNDLIAAEGKLGRSNMSGGLANAYTLANLGARTARDVNTAQQYALWREQQKRVDLDWLQRMYQGMMGQAGAAAGGKAKVMSAMQAPMGWAGIGGNMLQGGLGAYGMMGQLGLLKRQQGQAPPNYNMQSLLQGTPWAAQTPGAAPYFMQGQQFPGLTQGTPWGSP